LPLRRGLADIPITFKGIYALKYQYFVVKAT
jgi:hypothetical protein